MRMAQLIIASIVRAKISVVARLDETTRGLGGFGSTGIKNKGTNDSD
jgi:dUTP pyrophosphatase